MESLGRMGKMLRATTIVKTAKTRKQNREGSEGTETVRKATFMKVENKRKTGPKKVFQAGKTGLVLDLGKNL